MNFLGSVLGWVLGGLVGLIVLVGIIIALYIWSVYNSLIRMKNNVEEGYSTMDVYMKKRYDLIPNLVETVKGYAKHEKEALTSIIEARNLAMTATDPRAKADAENMITQSLKTIFALTENYPQLQANTNFMDLQNQLKVLENDIANARKYYNAVVKEYNNGILVFPRNIVAKKFNFKKEEMFEISPEHRENVKVEF